MMRRPLLALIVWLAAACDGASPAPAEDAATSEPESDAAMDERAESDAGAPHDDAGEPLEPGETKELVHFIGRFDADARFAWPGSALVATFTGTGLDVVLHEQNNNYFAVVIDGGAPTTLQTTSAQSTYTLASGLPPGVHTVRLTKKTESFQGVVQFERFVPHDGELVASAAPYARRIEFVGDSITCGYGNLGANQYCTFSPDSEDATLSYAMFAAEQLEAEATLIAYSGQGMLRDLAGDTTTPMPVRYERMFADDPASQCAFTDAPDVVVINLGTNDFGPGDPGQAYVTAYLAFLERLRALYPEAYLLCTVSPMLWGDARTQQAAYVEQVVSTRVEQGDERVAYFAFEVQRAEDGYGCDFHPSVASHERMAAALVPEIRALAGF